MTRVTMLPRLGSIAAPGGLAAQPWDGAGAGADLLDEGRQDAGAQGFADGFIAVEFGERRRPAQAEADIGQGAEAMGEPAAQPLWHVEAGTIGGKSRRRGGASASASAIAGGSSRQPQNGAPPRNFEPVKRTMNPSLR